MFCLDQTLSCHLFLCSPLRWNSSKGLFILQFLHPPLNLLQSGLHPPTLLLHWHFPCPRSLWLKPTVSSQSSSYLTHLIIPCFWKLYFTSRTLHSLPSLLTSYALSWSLRIPLGSVHGPLLCCLSILPTVFVSTIYVLIAPRSLTWVSEHLWTSASTSTSLEHQHHPSIWLLDSLLHHNSPEVFHSFKVSPHLNGNPILLCSGQKFSLLWLLAFSHKPLPVSQ